MQKRLSQFRFLCIAFFFIFAGAPSWAQVQGQPVSITVDAQGPSHPFPHFWEQMFGSGRAILSLRESYRNDLREVKQATNFRYIRFHAIFHDEVGIYSEDEQGKPSYNFSYVDQIYDGLLANGVKPFVELSFMPKQLASKSSPHAFWYKQNVAPPKDWVKWDGLISAFLQHLISRYGLDEVASWYFEVWNEPNIDFWTGDPKQSTYFELYDHTARAVKAANPRLRIGGPATAQAAWADAFIAHCAQNHVPVDFISSHVYGNDLSQDVFGTTEDIPRDKMVCRAVGKVHDQIKASAIPNLPLIWSEYNASYKNEPEVTDSIYMGPWLADTIRQCDGMVDILSYWSFSDVFEEQGVVKTPFYGGYGLIAADNIPKPAFNAFKVLHRLGTKRIAVDSDSILLTRRDDGDLILAAWNYAPPGEAGTAKTIKLNLQNTKASRALISRVDATHGDVRPAYDKMGAPQYPTAAEIDKLRHSSELAEPESQRLKDHQLILEIPAHGLVVVELK